MSKRKERKTVFVVMSRGDLTEDWVPEFVFKKRKRAKAYIDEAMADAPEEVEQGDFFVIDEVEVR